MKEVTRDFTATTFVVRADRTLLLWHNKMEAWLPPGGHIYPNELPEEAAIREVREETGLEVKLIGNQEEWGKVRVLRRPVCILLEEIEPGHQHIDLIYFGRSDSGEPVVNKREADRCRWYSPQDLTSATIATDICILGQRAIERVARL